MRISEDIDDISAIVRARLWLGTMVALLASSAVALTGLLSQHELSYMGVAFLIGWSQLLGL